MLTLKVCKNKLAIRVTVNIVHECILNQVEEIYTRSGMGKGTTNDNDRLRDMVFLHKPHKSRRHRVVRENDFGVVSLLHARCRACFSGLPHYQGTGMSKANI